MTSNRHCEQSKAIQLLQIRHYGRSVVIQWLQTVIASEAMILKGLWRKNPENQRFQGVLGLFDARIDDAAG